MSSDENLLETIFQRATDPTGDKVDEFAVRMFCIIVSKEADLIIKATDLIVSKVKSTNVTQSLRALSLLDECMSKGGPQFRKEVSKFRFLNELIRLVSKKYLALETNSEIREKIMDSLLIWTLQYPDKSKIKEAYDMLIKEGVQHAPACVSMRNATTSSKRASFLDEENDRKLKKLVQSKNPEDRQRANLLIQYLVNQDAKKTELKIRQKSELSQIQETVGLLNEILDSWTEDPNNKDGGESSLMKELYETCVKYKPILLQMPDTLESNEEDLIADTIETNDALLAVMERYQTEILPNAAPNKENNFTTSVARSGADDLLGDILGTQPLNNAAKSANFSNGLAQNLDELNAIFSKSDLGEPVGGKNIASELFKNIDLLQPICAQNATSKTLSEEPTGESSKPSLSYIDQLSENLLMESIPYKERLDQFKKISGNISLNDMIKEKSSVKVETLESSITGVIPSKSLSVEPIIKETVVENETKDHGASIPNEEQIPCTVESNLNANAEGGSPLNRNTVKHLADIHFELDDVTPSSEPPRVLFDDNDGLKVTLNLTSNRPSENITAVVITTVNQGKVPVENVQFDASVPKPCKLRLLPPTGTVLPGIKPFRPPTESIHQIILILNTTNANIDITCIMGYKTIDDPDPVKESVIAKNIPY